jgi:flagellar protein FlaJ
MEMAEAKKPDKRAYHPLISLPLQREKRDEVPFKNFVSSVASYFPNLQKKLTQAAMPQKPNEFIWMAMTSGLLLSIAICLLLAILFNSIAIEVYFAALLFPLVLVLSFFYFMMLPDVKALQRGRKIDQELVFAGRHMLIELKAGVPLFDAMLGISREYGAVSEEFNKIVEKVSLGISASAALKEASEMNTSAYFRRLVLQIANSLASGSDTAAGLESVLDQISREQVIALKAYGQKLNPIVMFFMIFGVIMPSLGVAFLVILLSFVGGSGVQIGASGLAGILLVLSIIQFLFLAMVETSRPKFDIL